MKRLDTGTRIILKSYYNACITKINIFQDQFLVAHTDETLLLGDLESCRLSEVPWMSTGKEKYVLDHPQLALVYQVRREGV